MTDPTNVALGIAAFTTAAAGLGWWAKRFTRGGRAVVHWLRRSAQGWHVLLGDETTPGIQDQLAVIREEQLVVRQELKEELERGAERMDRIEEKVDRVAHELNGHPDGIRDRLGNLDDAVAAIAEADKLRIKDAIAGDERKPVDRRSSST